MRKGTILTDICNPEIKTPPIPKTAGIPGLQSLPHTQSQICGWVTSDCNLGIKFSIPGFKIKQIAISGSRFQKKVKVEHLL